MIVIKDIPLEETYYGFSGCHRFEAHQRLGKETIKCRVRRAPPSVLAKHLSCLLVMMDFL